MKILSIKTYGSFGIKLSIKGSRNKVIPLSSRCCSRTLSKQAKPKHIKIFSHVHILKDSILIIFKHGMAVPINRGIKYIYKTPPLPLSEYAEYTKGDDFYEY